MIMKKTNWKKIRRKRLMDFIDKIKKSNLDEKANVVWFAHNNRNYRFHLS